MLPMEQKMWVYLHHRRSDGKQPPVGLNMGEIRMKLVDGLTSLMNDGANLKDCPLFGEFCYFFDFWIQVKN